MKTVSPKIILTIAGAFAFNFLFWEEKMAINFLIFDIFIISSILALYPTGITQGPGRWILAAHALCVAIVIIYNTEISKIAAALTLVLFAAFTEHRHRSVFFAAGSMIRQTTSFVPEFVKFLGERAKTPTKGVRPLQKLRLLLFPLGLLFLFFLIYIVGNRAFGTIAGNVMEKVVRSVDFILGYVSLPRVFFILFGAYITGALLLKSRSAKYSDRELSLSDRLLRIRKKRKDSDFSMLNEIIHSLMGKFSRGMLALKNRNLIGLLSIVMLNILLLFINLTDIAYIWLADNYGSDAPMAELLHEGTGVLIFSILLAILVVLFFFNGNINFYKNNKPLKLVTYAWLAQNAFLVVSVCIRDYYYIATYGLAYKRIGVLFFLAAVLAGLVSVFIKISYTKSNYFLFRFNGNVVLFLLVIASLQNWDVMIDNYNIARMDKIKPDIDFLMGLSDQTLPVIRKNLQGLERKMQEPGFNGWPGYRGNKFNLSLIVTEREVRFLETHKQLSWLSWNFADDKLYRELTGDPMFLKPTKKTLVLKPMKYITTN